VCKCVFERETQTSNEYTLEANPATLERERGRERERQRATDSDREQQRERESE